MGSKGKRYSAKFKFNVVLETLKSGKSDVEVARAYDVHPATVPGGRTSSSSGGRHSGIGYQPPLKYLKSEGIAA